jgi:hypothetical protein
MAKKTSSAPTDSEIPVSYGGKGRTGDRRDYVSIVGTGKIKHLATYPNDISLAHMADWRFADAIFHANGSGDIDSVKLMKAQRGYSLRKRDNQRLHLHLSLADVAVTTISVGTDEDVGTVVSTIEGDAVVFTLPKVIKGKYEYFKISRS